MSLTGTKMRKPGETAGALGFNFEADRIGDPGGKNAGLSGFHIMQHDAARL